MVYDDEGYVLWSLHNYIDEGGLYTKVYSQYGPFLYVLYHGLHLITGITFDNETARYLNLVYWVGTSGLAGLFVWRQSRSVIASAVTITITFASLIVMTSEPIHPGGMLAFCAALGAVLGAHAMERDRPKAVLISSGIIGAVMILTKINVGAFFFISVLSWLAMNLPHPKLARAFRWLTAVGTVLVPLALMHALWPTPWVAIYALAFSLSALSLILLLDDNSAIPVKLKQWPALLAPGAIVAVIILGAAWIRGTSLSELWHGIVIAPLNQPLVYSNAVNWPPLLPGLGVALILLAVYHHRHQPSWMVPFIIVARFGMVIGYMAQTYWADELSLTNYPFIYGIAFIWIMVVPLTKDNHLPRQNARLWVAWLFLWQTLQAYPVAGSQMSWGAFLWVPLAAVGCFEAIQFCAAKAHGFQRFIKVAGAAIVILYASVLLGRFTYLGYVRYTTCEPLGLAGAANLRIPDNLTAIYRILNDNIRLHGGMLFSYPGMFSYNLWTERPTPTAANVTHWWSLLDEQKQQGIIDQLVADDRAMIAVQGFLIGFLHKHGHAPHGILQNYLVKNFHSVIRFESFEIWVKNGRSVTPVSTATIRQGDTVIPPAIQLITDAMGTAATIEIRGLFHPHNRVASYPVSSTVPWKITSLNLDNSPASSPTVFEAPIALKGLARIEFTLPDQRTLPPLDLLEIVIRDPDGKPLDTLLFTQ